MSERIEYAKRLVDKIENYFGCESDEYSRAAAVHEFWLKRETGKNHPRTSKNQIMTELVGCEIEIKRLKGEKVGMGVAGHLKVKRVPVTHKVIGRGEAIESGEQ